MCDHVQCLHPTFTARSAVLSFDSTPEKEKAVQDMRTKMSKLLEARLKSGKAEDLPPHKSKQMVERLEHLLFQASPSLFAYQDKETLNDRMRSVVTAMMVQRRLQQRFSTRKSRSTILLKTLGRENFRKARTLVQEIRLCKNQKVATMKCTPGGVCTRPFRESFPPAIRSLFFETSLMDAFERAPIAKIPTLKWTELIGSAEENLRAYREWSS
mmetsp:Transcript_113753/g.170133  ORF Transcript_113753/g.170133 Transcript_113753/m.170133 type:complete len:213 (+) Transcript_113753:87-725(+)